MRHTTSFAAWRLVLDTQLPVQPFKSTPCYKACTFPSNNALHVACLHTKLSENRLDEAPGIAAYPEA